MSVGEPMAKETPAFPAESIEQLEQRPLYKTQETFMAEHAFIAIDQTGGSANFAITSGFFGPNGNLVVRPPPLYFTLSFFFPLHLIRV